MANWLMLWQQRTRREQRLLIGMGLLLAVGIIWYALWQPWLSREARWQQMLVREQATLRWMQQQTPRLQQLARHTPGAATATKEDLSAVIMREATRQELAIGPATAAGHPDKRDVAGLHFSGADDLAGRPRPPGDPRLFSGRQRSTDATRLGDGDNPGAGASACPVKSRSAC